MSFLVYTHTCPNGKKYIGQTSTSIRKRWGSNGSQYKNQVFYKAIEKYGWDNIEHNIIKVQTKQLANFWEIALIHYHNTTNPKYGYNINGGGFGGMKGFHFSHSDEVKKKISESKKGVKFSEEHRRKLSEAKKGNKCHKGCKHSEDAKKKMSINHRGGMKKGYKFTEEHKRNISIAKKLYYENK